MRALSLACLLACLLVVRAERPGSQHLQDSNFEHLTQAATGQTTGNWLIVFCADDTQGCKDMVHEWGTLSDALLAQNIMLAPLDVGESPKTAARFGVKTLPTLLLLKDRKMYKQEGLGEAGSSGAEGAAAQALLTFASAATEGSLQALEVPGEHFGVAGTAVEVLRGVRSAVSPGVLAPVVLGLGMLVVMVVRSLWPRRGGHTKLP